jgi:hypothetical protein
VHVDVRPDHVPLPGASRDREPLGPGVVVEVQAVRSQVDLQPSRVVLAGDPLPPLEAQVRVPEQTGLEDHAQAHRDLVGSPHPCEQLGREPVHVVVAQPAALGGGRRVDRQRRPAHLVNRREHPLDNLDHDVGDVGVLPRS